MLRVTVCELNDDPTALARDWDALVAHVRREASDLVLLPEMPFSPWLAHNPLPDPDAWQAAVKTHEAWLQRLGELAPARVLGTRPVVREGKRLNEAFVWEAEPGCQAAHTKYYLPDDEGFWENDWYSRGDGQFTPQDCGPVRVGILICTELWFFERARAYGKAGVQVLATPRATLRESLEKWLVGGRAAAIVSGAYALSSNKTSPSGSFPEFGGQGWVVEPDGEVLALTSPEHPFVTTAIDLHLAELARLTYPRYVEE